MQRYTFIVKDKKTLYTKNHSFCKLLQINAILTLKRCVVPGVLSFQIKFSLTWQKYDKVLIVQKIYREFYFTHVFCNRHRNDRTVLKSEFRYQNVKPGGGNRRLLSRFCPYNRLLIT